jgi:hypothetical protein
MKLTTDRAFADPDKAARRLMEHARAFEPVQDGRVYIEKINAPVRRQRHAGRVSSGARPRDCAGLAGDRPERTFVRFTQAGSDLFA